MEEVSLTIDEAKLRKMADEMLRQICTSRDKHQYHIDPDEEFLEEVLEGLKSYNNDVKYGYIQKDLTKDETEYLKVFEEEIEERLKHRRQMRIWEMIVT
ncbi:hypothetical protein Tco_0814583 [Tanacetum coccineum]